MIWYLLYFFRGTTEPPVLAANHILRRAFYRYGYAAARHWLVSILLSVAVAVLLCYPVVFLYENPTTGFSKLPLHVWTSARNFDGHPHTPPDVVIRQVWVHGDHMGALEKDVLLEALRIQKILVSNAVQTPALHEGSESGSKASAVDTAASGDEHLCRPDVAHYNSWGFHSPLMFWNCSEQAIVEDPSILDTIFNQSTRRSYLNLTMRPTSVFAGKLFERNKVTAADALILTLFDRRKSDTDRLWDRSFDNMAKDELERGNHLYPRDGHVRQYHLYEFQQKPLSAQDTMFLLISYFFMGTYVVVSLGKLRAVKSWVGLFITVLFEIAVSIASSFCICGLLRIDLARIPDTAYPFVVLVMGLENMFRLINAVLAQKPELPSTQRMATALSEVGHLSLATAAQMLFVLWFLAKVAPDVTAFCTFAAIALVIDYIFHLTFFYAVLSVDVRRMELQDLLDRVKITQPKRRQSIEMQERQWWLWAFLQGRLPFGNRAAGIATSTSFVLIINMHFEESSNPFWSLVQSVRSMFFHPHSTTSNPSFVAPPINQARTPAAWIRIQDYRYAQEVLGYVKPKATSIIARVYDPLVIVLRDANRSSRPLIHDSFFAMSWSLIRRHVYPFLLALIFCVAFVTLLMQCLLWNQLPEEELEEEEPKPPVLAVENLPKSHRLDVIHLTSSGRGHLISVSLDRLVTFFVHDARTNHFSLSSIYANAMTPPVWPVIALTLDESGSWAALCGPTGNVVIWNVAERRPSNAVKINLNDQHPILFSLILVDTSEDERLGLVVATPDGLVQIIDPFEAETPTSFHISPQKISLAMVARPRQTLTIVALTKSGKIRIATDTAGEWTVSAAEVSDPRLAPTSQEGIIKSVAVIPALNLIAATRLRVVDLVDMKTKTLVHQFPAILARGQSMRVLSSQVRQCRICSSPAVHSLSLAYNDFESHSLLMRTYTLSADHNDLMCLAPKAAGKSHLCRGLANAKEQLASVESPGSWEATSSQLVIGIRVKPGGADTPHSAVSATSGFEVLQFNMQAFESVKKRGNASDGASRFSGLLGLDRPADQPHSNMDDWEVYILPVGGEVQTQTLHSSNAEGRAQSPGEDELLVSASGPIIRLGQRSVAIGFGNRVKVIMHGIERFEGNTFDVQDLTQINAARRRKALAKRNM